jgi:hypothetical protein
MSTSKKPPEKTSVIKTARAQARAAAAYAAAAARIEKSDGALTPLDYMLSVVRDSTAAQTRRDRMAVAAAPYCHPRVADPVMGKKEQAQIDAVASVEGSEWNELLGWRAVVN